MGSENIFSKVKVDKKHVNVTFFSDSPRSIHECTMWLFLDAQCIPLHPLWFLEMDFHDFFFG